MTPRSLAGGSATVVQFPTQPLLVTRALRAAREAAGESQLSHALRLGVARELVELAEAGRLSRPVLLQHVERVLARCAHGLDRRIHGELLSFLHHEAVRQAHERIANALLDAEHDEQDSKDEDQW